MADDVEAFAVAVKEIDTFSALREAFVRFFLGEGVRLMSYHHMPPIGAIDYSPTITVVAYGFPQAWVDRYVAERFYEIDPIPARALATTHPFWWSEIERSPTLTRRERDYLDALWAQDFGDGVAIPLFGPHGRRAYSGLGPGKGGPRWSDAKIARLHWAAQLGHQQYCHILTARAPVGVALSQREREILVWIAQGKSNASIAKILEISPNTVDTYMRRIFDKLHVADRVTALLRSISIGVLN